MNILITSAGTRGYLIKYFKKALKEKGKIFAADCSKIVSYLKEPYLLRWPRNRRSCKRKV